MKNLKCGLGLGFGASLRGVKRWLNRPRLKRRRVLRGTAKGGNVRMACAWQEHENIVIHFAPFSVDVCPVRAKSGISCADKKSPTVSPFCAIRVAMFLDRF